MLKTHPSVKESVILPETKIRKIMTQPELGKKLVSLRQSKGLTQNELSEKCNVNVRTIQRIERGQVEPRPLTLKILLESLEEQFEEFMTISDDENYTNQNQTLATPQWKWQVAWIAGLVYFLTGFPEVYLDMGFMSADQTSISLSFADFSPSEMALYSLLKIIVVIAFACFIKGFVELASSYQNKLFGYAAYTLIGAIAIFYSLWLIGIYFDWDLMELAMIESVVTGICYVVFGALLVQLGNKVGMLAKISGLLDIIIGISFASIIVAPLGFIVLIPATLFKTYLLYSISNQKMELNLS